MPYLYNPLQLQRIDAVNTLYRKYDDLFSGPWPMTDQTRRLCRLYLAQAQTLRSLLPDELHFTKEGYIKL